MKAVVLCVLFLLFVAIFNVSHAQNGGQSHTNNFVSLSNFGYVSGHYNLKITNKQAGSVKFRVSTMGVHAETPFVAAGATLDYQFVAPENCAEKVQCKPLPPAVNPGPDLGQVEAKCMEGPDIIPLPVKFIYFKMEKSK